MKPLAVIFDMDGTLVDVSPYRHHVIKNPKNFEAFHTEVVNAEPIPWVLDSALDWDRKADVEVLIVTARDERYAMGAALWLHDHGLDFLKVFMRPKGDNRPDYEVKKEIYTQKIEPYWDILLAYDDNPNVIALWKEFEIPVVEVPGWLEADD